MRKKAAIGIAFDWGHLTARHCEKFAILAVTRKETQSPASANQQTPATYLQNPCSSLAQATRSEFQGGLGLS